VALAPVGLGITVNVAKVGELLSPLTSALGTGLIAV